MKTQLEIKQKLDQIYKDLENWEYAHGWMDALNWITEESEK